MEAGDETNAHIAKVRSILDQTHHDPSGVSWPSIEVQREAFAIAHAAGLRGLRTNCPSCHLQVINYLRSELGLHPIEDEAKPTDFKRRLDICRGNEKKGIERCEFLALGSLNCSVCLCFVDLKARMKRQKCPKGKW